MRSLLDIKLHTIQKLVYFLFGREALRHQILALFIPVGIFFAPVNVDAYLLVAHEIVEPFSVQVEASDWFVAARLCPYNPRLIHTGDLFKAKLLPTSDLSHSSAYNLRGALFVVLG